LSGIKYAWCFFGIKLAQQARYMPCAFLASQLLGKHVINHASPCQAEPRRAKPNPAGPRRAIPRLAEPRLALPRRASPSQAAPHRA